MFFIVWRGLGILVPLFTVAAFIAGVVLAGVLKAQFGFPEHVESAIGLGLAGLLAGGGLLLVATRIESKPGRVLIDAATNRQFTVKPSAGSFFFVPTRYWAYIVGLVGLVAAAAQVMAAFR